MDPFIPILQGSVARFASVLRSGPLDAPVPGCPGWDVHRLARHLGFVQRWARLAATTVYSPGWSGSSSVENSTALRRLGRVEEIAWPCLFFASEASSFVTGQTLSIDGGPSSLLFVQGRE